MGLRRLGGVGTMELGTGTITERTQFSLMLKEQQRNRHVHRADQEYIRVLLCDGA